MTDNEKNRIRLRAIHYAGTGEFQDIDAIRDRLAVDFAEAEIASAFAEKWWVDQLIALCARSQA
ncbi:hypothetical protein KK137_06310 [Croceibacterium sp. LX-88]|uniref:Uncharacterized protein n=1 Tax=Croceibacterium selenioxidans TaxID=2838833 RepID=A0ABS5W3P6_9SPHN|nr:hypothetical protein [Croceibacterium selenioxidans]MBT2133942.1 hypothetical protein [Croceibacterium selenioxidans]